jgi:hypothetical protein
MPTSYFKVVQCERKLQSRHNCVHAYIEDSIIFTSTFEVETRFHATHNVVAKQFYNILQCMTKLQSGHEFVPATSKCDLDFLGRDMTRPIDVVDIYF